MPPAGRCDWPRRCSDGAILPGSRLARALFYTYAAINLTPPRSWRDIFAGFDAAFFALLLPMAMAAAMGGYLFYVQHSFPGMVILPAAEWTHYRAALVSSSYLRLGPVLRWFSGNIGFHHVHHLNSLIPFYRLPEAMAAIPEIRHPTVTTLRPRDIVACFHANVWDEAGRRMVRYRDVPLVA